MTEEIVLEVKNLSATYGNSIVFNTVSFKIKQGQFVGLLGGNGSGKTTLLKIIAGELTPKSGDIFFKNALLVSGNAVAGMEKGIVYLHQSPTTFPDLFAWENFLIWSSVIKNRNPFDLTKKGVVSFLQSKLSFLGLAVSLDKKVSELTEVELQILEFAKFFIVKACLVLVDETTSVLDLAVSGKILAFLKRYCSKGGSVIFISHRFNELRQYSDVIYELKDRSLFARIKSNGEQPPGLLPGNPSNGKPPGTAKELALELDMNAKKGNGKFYLQLFKEEIIGITGLDGSWYEHMPQLILDRLEWMYVHGTTRRFRIGRDFSFLGKNRETDWVFPLQTVGFNLAIANDRSGLMKKSGKIEIEQLMAHFKIAPLEWEKPVNELSGGNKMKTAFARTMLLKCPVNILNEPFTGIDAESRAAVIDIIRDEARINKASFILFSKEHTELLTFCDRIIAFNNEGDCRIFESASFSGILGGNPETILFN